jgi:hypothetical protein
MEPQSIEEIYNEMIAEKQSLTALNDLMPQYNLAPPSTTNPFVEFLKAINTESKAGMWRLWLFIVAVAARAQQVFFIWHKNEVDTKIANHKPGTLLWYRSETLLFQINHQLVWKDDRYQYLVNDPNARIVKQCVAKKTQGVIIKAAKDDGNGGLMELSISEVSQLQAFWNRYCYADHDVYVFSFKPDDIRVAFTFYYDPLSDIDDLQTLAKSVLKKYLRDLSLTDFGGVLLLNAMVDQLQGITQIKNPVPISFMAKYGNNVYEDRLQHGYYDSNAGYAVLDETFFDNQSVWIPVL